MAASSTIHVRVEESVKREASDALAKMGLTVSGAVNLFLTRVAAEQAIPFEVRLPNASTRAAIAEADEMATGRRARFSRFDKLMQALETPGE